MADKLLAEWFWTDRWMGSSAFLLPMEARGAYREMLTQAWRRGARLPNDLEAIQRAIGATTDEWNRCWPKIKSYWRQDGDSLVNDTQVAVYAECLEQKRKASERGRLGAQARHAQAGAQAQPEQVPEQCSPSPSLSPISESVSDNPPSGGAGGNGVSRHPKRSRRVPQEFEPTPERIRYATEAGLVRYEVENEWNKMCDHEFNTPRSDWDAVWRTWVRNVVERKTGATSHHGR